MQQKYIELVSGLLELYQQTLLAYMRNCTSSSYLESPNVHEFKRNYNVQLAELRTIEVNKAIDYRISELCQEMTDFCSHYERINKTSVIPHRADRSP